MAWLILLASGLLETAWAAALQSATIRPRPLPIVVFVVTATMSVAGLGIALRSIPIGTGYAVWVAIGVIGTFAYGAIALEEPVDAVRLGCVALILTGVAGLKLAT